MKEHTGRILYGAYFLLIFGFLFLWFFGIHPLIPFDGDDWSYLAYVRPATPVWGDWNPAKVFPEIVYPFFSSIAAFALTPLTGDYISAQTIMHALVVSSAITGYLWCFSSLMRRLFSCSRLTTALITTIFLSLHFLVFRTAPENNRYLFSNVSVNCYYNYLLPMLLNSSLVMLLLANPGMDAFLHTGRPELRGIFFLVMYLTVFSNMAASGILAAYAGSQILLSLIRQRKGLRIRSLIRENAFLLGILIAWLVSAVFELNGGRAASSLVGISLVQRIHTCCYLLKSALLESNRLFLAGSAVVVFSALICVILDVGPRRLAPVLGSVISTLLIAAAAIVVYMVLLCAAVDPAKIAGCSYLFAVYFPIFLLVLIALGYLICRLPWLLTVLPLLTLFLISNINTSGNTFCESNTRGLPAEQCAALSRYIVQQFQDMDASGAEEMTLYVPQFVADPETQDNWPYSLFLMERVSDTLYSHGVTSRRISAVPVADPEVNALFHLPVPSK